MGSKVFDPEGFGQALKALAEGEDTPYVRIATAMRHVENTSMHPLAFGVIGGAMVKGEYEQSVTYLTEQLDKGAKTMKAVLAGLNRVAANNQGAEQANLIDPKDIKLPEVKATDSNAEKYIEGAALYFWKIGLLSMLTGVVNEKSRTLAPTAGVAVLLWLLYMPDDEAISKAHSHWTHAADELDAFDRDLQQKMKALNDTWKGPASDTFVSFMDGFKGEVDECLSAVRDNATVMARIQIVLTIAQHIAFVHAIANLIVLAALEILKMAPPTRAPATIAQQIVGGILSVTTGGQIAMFGAYIAELGLAIFGMSLMSFVTEKEGEGSETDSNGVDFKEVALSQDDIDRLVSDAK